MEKIFMSTKRNLKEICNLFNKGLLNLQDAVIFCKSGYILNCNDGKVTSITKEAEGK